MYRPQWKGTKEAGHWVEATPSDVVNSKQDLAKTLLTHGNEPRGRPPRAAKEPAMEHYCQIISSLLSCCARTMPCSKSSIVLSLASRSCSFCAGCEGAAPIFYNFFFLPPTIFLGVSVFFTAGQGVKVRNENCCCLPKCPE
jgi:hypothetical protein